MLTKISAAKLAPLSSFVFFAANAFQRLLHA